ncbi:patatin-like phospholipase family protein [Oceanobacter mangrovi]|uniref:patatin-like phospholipase family protein n=1 Tax=Oceanobacter mangrovi TaxID=2862510 RepID=UPI001C8D98ED|nr:patatin-like phospholipase family protein [Oceanobacter mangrovi]
MSKTVALALGSGGARGYAHIGVLDALQERGYEVVAISGSSMGALIGGFYCAGKLDEYRDWVSGLNYLDVLKLVDVSLLSGGVIRGDKVFNMLAEMLDGVLIEDLPIPFTAVATDMQARKEIWFQSGSLDTAIRASAAIPSIFSPVKVNGRHLVDGGVLNPLPISPCVSVHADHIIAVDLNSDTVMPDDFGFLPAETNKPQKQAWFNSVVDKATNWLESRKGGDDVSEHVDENIGKLEMINQMFETMQLSLTRFKTAAYPPDLLIKMPMESCEMYEFYRARELIALGYHIANQALDAYEHGGASPYAHRMG